MPLISNDKQLIKFHDENCQSKDSLNVERRNVIFQGELSFIVEYDVYCKECGKYLYSYSYGKKFRYDKVLRS